MSVDAVTYPRPPAGALRENIPTGNDRFDRRVAREHVLLALPHDRAHAAAALAERTQQVPADKSGCTRQ